jgi:cytosine/adenosine deaminase-related metal-dependent hydrolase
MVITQRNALHPEEAAEHMQAADLEMWNNGIVATGDISNGPASFRPKSESKLLYHTFVELLGLDPRNSGSILDGGIQLLELLTREGLSGSLAPHAPYSTSIELMKVISNFNAKSGAPISIHNQESMDEIKFLAGHKSGFDDLYKFLDLDISWFKPPGTSGLKYFGDVVGKRALLVHNTFTQKADLVENAAEIFWCLCPAANEYIEQRLPDFSVFKGNGNICIGTDSLAGNTKLDLVCEANFILGGTSAFTLDEILGAMTSNGARALGLDNHVGRLLPGKKSGLNLLEYKNKSLQFIRKLS